MPRFVILEHDHPDLHWDLMLEAGEVLRTWRLVAPPTADQVVSAESSFDHRPFYLDYEGPISGNRGRVERWDFGAFEWLKQEVDEVSIVLTGQRLRGLLHLRPTSVGSLLVAQYEPRS